MVERKFLLQFLSSCIYILSCVHKVMQNQRQIKSRYTEFLLYRLSYFGVESGRPYPQEKKLRSGVHGGQSSSCILSSTYVNARGFENFFHAFPIPHLNTNRVSDKLSLVFVLAGDQISCYPRR